MSYIHYMWCRGADLTILFARKQGLKGLSGRVEMLTMGITQWVQSLHCACSILVDSMMQFHVGLLQNNYTNLASG